MQQDRKGLIARISSLRDEELERIVFLLDMEVFLEDVPILQPQPLPDDIYSDQETIERVKRLRSERDEDNKQIGALLDHGAFRQLQQAVVFSKERFWHRQARKMADTESVVDQRVIDYRRGFYKGAHWAVNLLPKQIQSQLKEDEDKNDRSTT